MSDSDWANLLRQSILRRNAKTYHAQHGNRVFSKSRVNILNEHLRQTSMKMSSTYYGNALCKCEFDTQSKRMHHARQK